MGLKFNPLLFSGFDFSGSGGGSSPYFGDPVANEASLPASGTTGEIRVAEDTDHIYVWDSTTNQWIDSGITLASAVGSSPNASGVSINQVVSGNVTHQELQLQPTDATNPGIITTGSQTIAGTKTLSSNPILSGTNINTALVVDASKQIQSSITTSTELEYVSGVTSSIQTQLDSKIPLAQKGVNNGVATLDAGGKIPVSQLPSSVLTYEGTWNAATNTPTLADGVGDAGMVYITSVAGTTDFGSGPITFAVGDWAIYNGTVWQKSINSNAVVSVNGQQGIVTLDTDDIPEGAALYFTDERAQDSVGGILNNTATINLTYDDVGGSITADVIESGLSLNNISGILSLAKGGTNKNITPVAGAVVYSDADSLEISAAGVTGQVLKSGGSGAPSWENIDATEVSYSPGTPSDWDIPPITVDIALDTLASSEIVKTQTANTVFAGPTTGSPALPTFRSLTINDLPPITHTGDDIPPTSFSGADGQISPANVTGFLFDSSVTSFEALVNVSIDATTDLYTTYKLLGVNKGSDWTMQLEYTGDNSLVNFNITSGGQIQYVSSTYPGFNSLDITFRAFVLNI